MKYCTDAEKCQGVYTRIAQLSTQYIMLRKKY